MSESRPAHVPRELQQQEWFEVFFDLVFAVAVAFWADRVAQEPSAAAYARSAAYILPIWWVWLGQTTFVTRFPAGSLGMQALSIAQVIAVGVMSISLLHRQPTSVSFPLGFVAARLALLAMYLHTSRRSPDAKAIARVYLLGFGTGAAIWALSALLPAGDRPMLWAIGLGVDFATPWLGRPTLQRMPLEHHHLSGRVSLFNSLLLYVAVEGIVRGLAEKGWGLESVAVALLCFTLVVSLWWIYAARVNRGDLGAVLGSGQPYLYSQFFVVLGVGTCSTGIRALGARHAMTLLASGMFSWIFGLVLIRAFVLRHRDRYWHVPFVLALIVIPLLALAGAGRPMTTLLLLDAVVLALLTIELRHGAGHAGPVHHL